MNKLIFIFFFLVFSCQNEQKDSSQKTLTLALTGEISTLDPASAYDTISNSVIYQSYEQLYQYHYLKRPYQVIPLLAEGMPKISEDGKTYTIKIKKDILYHPHKALKKGRTVKAQDFITQIKRLAFIPTQSNGAWLFKDKIVGFNEFRKKAGDELEKFKKQTISGLQAPDDHTLVVKLTEPYPQMIFALSMAFSSPMPLELVEYFNNDLSRDIVGTGPYKLKSWNPLSGVKLTRFENFRDEFYPTQGDRLAHSRGFLDDAGKKLPFIDEIRFQIIKEDQTRWLNFLAGKIDMIVIPKDNYSSAITQDGELSPELKKKNIKLLVAPTLTFWWLAFNMRDSIVGENLNLRKAIAHAVDVEKYIKVFTNNIGLKANSIYPPGTPGYSPSHQQPYEYDPKKAKKFLKKAGHPRGKGLPTLTYDVRGSSAKNRQQAQYIKSELAKVGIEVKISLNTFPVFLEKARKGELQFWQGGWAMDYPDAENILQLLVTQNHAPGPNTTFYSNPKVNALFEKLKALPNDEKKFKLMRKIEKIVNRELPWIMQYYARNYILHHDRLKNYRNSDLIFNNIKYLKISE